MNGIIDFQYDSPEHKNVHEWIRQLNTQRYLDLLSRKYGKIPYLKTRCRNHDGTSHSSLGHFVK